MTDADGKPRCGAHARSSGRPCRLPAGYGTDHPGEGRCKYHGGAAGSGGQQGNRNAERHGLSAQRCRVTELRRELEQRIEAAEGERDPLSVKALAQDLLDDARRLQARSLVAEQRIDELMAAGKFDRDAQAAADLLMTRLEGTLVRLRSVQAGLVGRFPVQPRVADGDMGSLVVGHAEVGAIHVHPGSSIEDVRSAIGLDSDLPPPPAEPEPEGEDEPDDEPEDESNGMAFRVPRATNGANER